MTDTVACGACAMPIPPVIVHAPFCPYCGTKRAAPQIASTAAVPANPYLASAAIAPNVPAAVAPTDSPFDASVYCTAVGFDPRVGYVLVGAHALNDEAASIRAYDVMQRRVLWEAFAGEAGVEEVDADRLRIVGGTVYVAVQRSLRAVDLFDGRFKWGAELSDIPEDVDGDGYAMRGMRLADPSPPGARGAVWVVAVDDQVFGFDRDTGQPLFREARDPKPRRFIPYEGGRLVVESSDRFQLVDPFTRQVVDTVEGRIRRFDLDGRHGVFHVRRWGWRERDGILVHDFSTKKEVLFEAVENLEHDVPSVTAPGRVYCAAESGAKLVATPKTKSVELVAGFHIRQLLMCGPTLFALLVKHHGTSVRRVVGVDPQSLAVRFDLGELTTQPTDDWPYQMCTDGNIVALVTSAKNDDEQCEIVGIDATGRTGWRTPVGEWQAHRFLGGNIVVQSIDAVRILRPQDGQVLGEYRDS